MASPPCIPISWASSRTPVRCATNTARRPRYLSLIGWLAQFNGDFTLQTCFLRGEHNGQIIDNTTPEELEAWYQAVETLHPKQIMIYVIDRKTPEEHLEKIPREQMESIAAPLIEKGFEVSISA